MKLLLSLFAMITTLLLAEVVVAESPLEVLKPDGALENVTARDGVVFVDLYADW